MIWNTSNSLAIRQIGTPVPGPLHKTKSGFVFQTIGKEDIVDFKVVKMVDSHDWETSRHLRKVWINKKIFDDESIDDTLI